MNQSMLTTEAVADFDRLCSLLGISSMSQKQFIDVLHDYGILLSDNSKNDSLGIELFKGLVIMCREAEAIARKESSLTSELSFSPSKFLQDNQIDTNALKNLYEYHPAYTTCCNPMNSSLALTEYVKEIFQNSLKKGRKTIRRNSSRNLLQELLLSEVNEEKKVEGEKNLDDAVDELNRSHGRNRFSSTFEEDKNQIDDDGLSLEMVASSLIRYTPPEETKKRINPKYFFHGKLPNKIYDPFCSDSNDFVSAVEAATLDHDALKHHVLMSLSMGLWNGLRGTLQHLSSFMDAYRHFTSTFCSHLKSTLDLVGDVDPSAHYVRILEANMEEEKGM